MTLTRSLRKAISGLLVAVLFFSQLAVSAYACQGEAQAAMHPATMQVDDDAANLCIEHCRYGQQSADHSPSPAPMAAALIPLYPAAPAIEAEPQGRLPLAPDAALAAAPPPHAILHCCLRT